MRPLAIRLAAGLALSLSALALGSLAAPAQIGASAQETASLEAAGEPSPEQAPAQASEPAQSLRTGSGLPLPRYVSLKAERVNLRVGPGRDYPVSWLFLKAGLPMEVIQEYDNWRRVRDSEGSEGWVFHSLLSGERTALTAPWLKGKAATVEMRRAATNESRVVALMEPGVLAHVSECSFGWCRVSASGTEGFVTQNELWGVYPDEKF